MVLDCNCRILTQTILQSTWTCGTPYVILTILSFIELGYVMLGLCLGRRFGGQSSHHGRPVRPLTPHPPAPERTWQGRCNDPAHGSGCAPPNCRILALDHEKSSAVDPGFVVKAMFVEESLFRLQVVESMAVGRFFLRRIDDIRIPTISM